MRKFQLAIKHSVDFIVAVILLIALLPIFVITAICIKIESKGPVFYSQQRVGKDMKLYQMYKFRSMKAASNDSGLLPKSKHDPRITKIGKFIRASSIDELPQLWNVIKAEMSLVGPRPRTLADKPLEHYCAVDRSRFHMRPGITGLAQVKGRNLLSWDEMMQWDVAYVENFSLLLDIKILLLTLKTLIFREGIYRQ